MDKLIMTPGPTYVTEEVRRAMSRKITNPDLDGEFFECYKRVTEGIQKMINTENDVLILGGEGILGLEAACASLIEPGDKVLCIENGVFGEGFGDFAKLYGGEVTYFHGNKRKGIDESELAEFLKENNDFKIATMVHCETPSAITNQIDKICPLLKEYGILTVVDAVASMGGEELNVDEWGVDIVLGGSQKCISAPPGLTIVSISDDAWVAMKSRKESIKSFYANLLIWENWYEDKWFPYTQSISDIYALEVAVDNILKEGRERVIARHTDIAKAVRVALEECGIELFVLDSHSTTVTAFIVPQELTVERIKLDMLNEHNIMIAGSLGNLKDSLIRIGHMGENCREDRVYLTLKALNGVLRKYNVELKSELHRSFVDKMNLL